MRLLGLILGLFAGSQKLSEILLVCHEHRSCIAKRERYFGSGDKAWLFGSGVSVTAYCISVLCFSRMFLNMVNGLLAQCSSSIVEDYGHS